MPTNTSGGTTTSFSNTPQATDDGWMLLEDYSTVAIFDVMADDLGGKAKILWSLDDGTNQDANQTLTSADLLTQDTARAECLSNDTSMNGARIWITADGKVGYDAGNLSAAFRTHLNSLAVGETATDTFVYAIRLASGTLSWATVTITYSGTNDAATITSAAQTGGVVEDGAQSSSGAVTFNDVDLSDGHTATFTATPGNATTLGTFSIAAVDEAAGAANGSVGWAYQLDNDAAQYLGVGETVYESFVVAIDDGHGGTVSQTVRVAIVGSNDAVTVVAAGTSATGAVVEDSADTAAADDHAIASGSIAFTDVDLSDTHSVSFAPAAGQTALGEFELAPVDEAANASGGNVGWTYTIDESAAQYLGAGQTLSETYIVSITDNHGSTVTQNVTVTITGTNDSVVVVNADTVASGTVVENSGDTAAATDSGAASGTIAFSDADLIDTHEASFVAVEGQTSLGTFELAPVAEVDGAAGGTVGWTYTIDESAAQYLAAGQSVTETYTVSIIDHHGSTVTQDVTVTITGTNDLPVINIGEYDQASTTLGETDDGLTTSGTLTVNDVDTRDTVTTTVTGVSVAGTAGALTNDQLKAMLAITSGAAAADGEDGNIGWAFDSGSEAFDYLAVTESLTLTYTLTATDSSGGTGTQTVTITITGTNDVPTVSAAVEVSSNEDAATDLTVDLLAGAHDDDTSDVLHVANLALTGGDDAGVTINGDSLTVDQAAYNYLAVGESAIITYSYDVIDSHTGGTVAQTATITITGANDAPTVAHAIADQSVDEDHAVLFQVPADAFSDVDASDTLTYSATLEGGAALPGWLSFNSTTRTFSGTPPQDFNGVLSVAVTASDGDASVSDTFDLTINAVNDAPVNVIAGYSVNEDTPTQITGLSVGDVDAGSSDIQVTLSVASGTLSATGGSGVAVSGSGSGTIELTGTVAAINAFLAAATAPTFTPALNASGEVSLTMTTTDNGNSGSGGALTDTDQVTINVASVNDASVIVGDTAKAITEDAVPNTVSGNLDSSDVDGVNDSWQAQTIASANGYGSLAINATGNWTYTLDNSNGTVNALNTGSTPLTDVFTVRTADGTTQQITVTINGHTDAPPVAGPTANDDVLYISSGTNPSTFSLASFLGNDVLNGATFAITGGAATYDAATQTITFSSANPGAFTYSLTNAGGTDSATVNVNVVNVTGNANTVDLSANSYAASYFDMRGGNDTFIGSLVVVGSRGDDRVIGSTDNDILDTKGGTNVLSGGDGSDDFIITNWAGMTNHITDFEAGTATNTAATALDQLYIDIGASGANVFSVGDNDTVVETGEVVINSTTSFADSAAVQAYIDSQALTQGALFVAFNAQLGHAAVYYDANPSAAGGAVLVAELDSVSTLAAVTNINSGDFVFF